MVMRRVRKEVIISVLVKSPIWVLSMQLQGKEFPLPSFIPPPIDGRVVFTRLMFKVPLLLGW